MNEQIKSRRVYYARELHAIEEAHVKERQELIDKYNNEWNSKLDERRNTFKEVNICTLYLYNLTSFQRSKYLHFVSLQFNKTIVLS